MTKKVVLITGASSGIGRAAAEKFLKQGYTVYGAARTESDLKYLNNYPDGHYQIMDITEANEREACVKKILKKENKIDILVNNAGYGAYGAVEEVPLEEVKRQFEVNLFGLSELTKLVIPGMRENNSGKIINISSIAGKIWTPLGGWYHASKFALEGLSDCLRNELREFGIDVILIEPGAIETNWADTAGKNLMKNSGEGVYQKQAQKKAAKYEEMFGEGGMAVGPEVVAESILKAAESSHPKARYAVPTHAKLIIFFRWLLPDSIYDYFTNKFF
jgi:short-subunit dehydrogenase